MKKITFAALAVPLMWVLLLLLFSNYKVYAQERLVLSGIVKSADGSPLEGVTVWQKDTDNGTQTNEQGFYTLSVISNATITFEYLGFKTQQLKASANVLNVTMQIDDDTLEELVINAGYYTVTDKERTGSISKITSKEIGQQPVANPLAAMQGRMAGVNITQSSGTPGGGFDIQIRGRNSLRTEGNAPLYIVDGVPYPSQSSSDPNVSIYSFSGGNISPLNSINPSDIENIEVLKDADATAIYGSRGSNGVVLITTKKGSSDKTTFSLQSTTSVSTVAGYMDLMKTDDYLKMRRDAYVNDGISTYPANAYDLNGTWNQDRYTDWQKEFIGGKGVSQNTQFSVGGGSGQTSYLFSAGHRNDATVFPGDFGYKRTNFSINANHQSKNKKFDTQINIIKSSQKNNLMSADFTKEIYLVPNAPELYDNQGNLNWENNTFLNPVAKLNGIYRSETEDLISNVTLRYKMLENLIMSVNGGVFENALNEVRTIPSTIYSPSLNRTSAESVLHTSDSKRKGWIIEPKLAWNLNGEYGKFDALIGGTFEERTQEAFSLQAGNFTSNDLIFNVANAGIKMILFDTESRYRYMAAFARFNYTLKDRYIVNVTGRRDGSSRFGPDKRFGNFGAVGAAWLFSREKLFDDSSWLNFGKLRMSYGLAGSDLIGDYQYLNTFGISRYKYDGVSGLEPLRLFNPDFSWETNKKLEGALELEFFKGRLSSSVAWYRNRSSSQLVGIPLPATTGFNSVQANLAATVENSGWEFVLRSSNIIGKDFEWSMGFNMTIPRNKLVAFPNLEESTYAARYHVGLPTSIVKLYKYTGINKETGIYEFEDVNNDGVLNADDRQTKVNLGVTLFGGLQNSFRYRNWTLDFNWMFVKQKVYSPDYYGSYLGSFNNQPARAADYFSQDNKNARYQIPTTGANSKALQAYQNYNSSDGVVTDGSYIRLKSLQLQYTLDSQWLKGKTLTVNLQGFNLITITKYWGSDPETHGSFLPALRTIAMGFNINF
ncbi:MAG: SusC/RagA family TonB-linked outer membrane protein [Myroides sp.]|nr:SusC/RagA family TonB-linked outer membrane protein [Myroides sp.]